MTREALHFGFDALYVAFQGSVSEKTREALTRAKEQAQHVGKPIYTVISGIAGHVGATGTRGGYRYKFDQGPLAAKWLIKESDNPTEWNLYCEVPAMALVEYGIEKCIDDIWADLKAFDARIISNAVNRFDVAVDIMDADFILRPERISAHSHSTVQRFGQSEAGNNDFQIIGGSRIETVTIGKMPNRQVTIYDKRKQVIYSQKSHWWKFWNREKADTPAVWRVELRFGKKYLKRSGIVTLDDMLTRGGDLVAHAFEDVKYLDQENASHVNATRSKLDGFWAFARDLLIRFASGAMVGGKHVNVRQVIREDHKKFCEKQIIGFFKNMAATRLDLPDFPDAKNHHHKVNFLHNLTRDVVRRMECFQGKAWHEFEEGVQKVRKKYHYLERKMV